MAERSLQLPYLHREHAAPCCPLVMITLQPVQALPFLSCLRDRKRWVTASLLLPKTNRILLKYEVCPTTTENCFSAEEACVLHLNRWSFYSLAGDQCWVCQRLSPSEARRWHSSSKRMNTFSSGTLKLLSVGNKSFECKWGQRGKRTLEFNGPNQHSCLGTTG